jgi:hypothetical protein
MHFDGALQRNIRRDILLVQTGVLTVAPLSVVGITDSKIVAVDVHLHELIWLVIVGRSDPNS